MMKAHSTHGVRERDLQILDAIVRLNIETGRQVSSGLVERYLKRAYSSATIRAVMKRWEESGHLEQPHTSAGRLPTDAGYRVFVDRLQAGWALRRHEVPREMRRLVRSDVRRAEGSQDRLKILAGLLNRLTNSIGIILGEKVADLRVTRLECYQRGTMRALIVVILENESVRTRLVDLGEETSEPVLADAARELDRRVRARSLAQIRRQTLPMVDLVDTPVSRCLSVLARGCHELFEAPDEGELELEGVSQMLNDPEFQEPASLRALIRFMESPAAIRQGLSLLESDERSGFGVWIGQENPVSQLRCFSTLTGRVDLDGRPGMLAVLGPRRMPYLRAFHGIDTMRKALAPPTGTVS